MINYEILGEVTARDGSREADLTPQPRLMLARLVIERGRPVPRSELERALDLERKSGPGKRLKGVASELRGQLRSALSIEDPQASGDGSYRLTLRPEQADVLRFHTGLANARGARGPDRARLLREALEEWPSAAGLYGGYPLSGLRGPWADSTRVMLRTQYRGAVMGCIEEDMNEGHYEKVVREFGQVASHSEALGDDEFVGKWMCATYLSGDQAQALRFFRQAAEYMKSLKRKPSEELRDLEWKIRKKDPRLGRPGDLADRTAVPVPEAVNVPPTYNLLRPVGGTLPREPGRDDGERQPPNVSINVGDRARPGSVIGVNNGQVHVHGASPGNPAAVLLTSTSDVPAGETPLEGRWRAGEEGWLGERRYLLLDDNAGLISEDRDRSGDRVRRQAIGRQIDPEPEAGQACVWLRRGGRDLTRERDLLARAHGVKTGGPAVGDGAGRRQGNRRPAGFPRVTYHSPGPGAVTLAVSWPSERDDLPAGTLGVRFPPGSLDKWRVERLLTGMRGLVTTLERLHRLGASHRNLSPQSIIVTGRGQWVLRDLGLAAVSFRPGEGPEGYQAPEQAFGSRLDKPGPATDVYQLAAVIYHLVTGRIAGRNSPPARHEGLPEAVTDVIGAALAARPAERPGTRDLRMALNEPGAAGQPGI